MERVHATPGQLATGSDQMVESIDRVEGIAGKTSTGTREFLLIMEEQQAVIEQVNASAQELKEQGPSL